MSNNIGKPEMVELARALRIPLPQHWTLRALWRRCLVRAAELAAEGPPPFSGRPLPIPGFYYCPTCNADVHLSTPCRHISATPEALAALADVVGRVDRLRESIAPLGASVSVSVDARPSEVQTLGYGTNGAAFVGGSGGGGGSGSAPGTPPAGGGSGRI